MGATYHHDPGAKERSPMLRQLVLCNGQQTGYECVHYWRQVARLDVLNPDNLRKGMTYRYCERVMNAPEHPLALFMEGDNEMPTECSRYTPDRRRKYDPNADDYAPLTPEEIRALQDGRAVPRFSPKKWWQFWRKKPVVEVVYLTPEEIAALQAKKIRTTTSDAADGTFQSDIFTAKPGPLTDAHTEAKIPDAAVTTAETPAVLSSEALPPPPETEPAPEPAKDPK